MLCLVCKTMAAFNMQLASCWNDTLIISSWDLSSQTCVNVRSGVVAAWSSSCAGSVNGNGSRTFHAVFMIGSETHFFNSLRNYFCFYLGFLKAFFFLIIYPVPVLLAVASYALSFLFLCVLVDPGSNLSFLLTCRRRKKLRASNLQSHPGTLCWYCRSTGCCCCLVA